MDNPKRLTIFTVLIWSTGATLGRTMSLSSPFPLFAMSFGFALLTFWVYSSRIDRRPWRLKLAEVRPRFVAFGSLGYFFYWVGIAESMRAYSTVAEPVVLNYTWPLFTALFTELFFRARRSGKPKAAYIAEAVGVSMGFLATLIMVTEGHVLSFHVANLAGLLWGLFGGACYGVYSAFSSTVPRQQQMVFLMCSAAVGSIGMAVLATFDLRAIGHISPRYLLVALAMGVLVDGIGYIAWTRVNRLAKEQGVSVASVTSLVYLLPVLSLCVAGVWFGEFRFLQPYFLVVLVLVTVGSVLCQPMQKFRRFQLAPPS